MKLGVMQPYFFPYIGYFQLISAVDRFILYDKVGYIKKGWVNRNRILEINREPVYICVPLKKQNSFRSIADAVIDDQQYWGKKIINSIHFNYKRSSHYSEIMPVIEETFDFKTDRLTEINILSIELIAKYLDIETEIVANTDDYEQLERELASDDSFTLRSYSDRNIRSKMVMRVLEICRNEDARTFISAIGGGALYDKNLFKANGIDLYFINTLPYRYKQASVGFHANLSIIDALMNCGKEETKKLIHNYNLI